MNRLKVKRKPKEMKIQFELSERQIKQLRENEERSKA